MTTRSLPPAELQEDRRALALHRQAIERRLTQLARRLRGCLAVDGLFWTVLAAVGLLAAAILLDWLLRPERAARIALAVVAVVALAVVVARRLVRPMGVTIAPLDLAQLLDRRLPGVGQQLANVLQLPSLIESDLFASPSLIVATVERQSSALAQSNWNGLLALGRRNAQLAGVAALFAGTAAFVLLAPDVAGLWARRWVLGANERWPQKTYLSVDALAADANRFSVPKGEGFNLQVSSDRAFQAVASSGGESGRWTLAGRGEPFAVRGAQAPASVSPEDVQVVHGSANVPNKLAHFVRFGDGQFRYEMPPLVEPTVVSISGGDDWLIPIWIDPVERPSIAALTLIATAPLSEPRQFTIEDFDSQLAFLPTTDMQLTLVAKEPLASADLSAGEVKDIQWRKQNDRTWQAHWRMSAPTTLEFRLASAAGSLSSKPYYLSIGILQDREPRVSIRASGVGRRVTPVAQVPLVLRALDDFGLGRLNAEMEQTTIAEERPATAAQTLEVARFDDAPQPVLEMERRHTVSLRESGLAPGAVVRLRGSAVDRSVLGPRTGVSRWLSFQVVTPEELFYEILTRQREQRARFTVATNTVKSMAAAIDTLADAESLPALHRNHQVVARSVWQIANQLAASHEELTLNDLGTPQARDLLANNVVAPLRSLHDDQLPRLKREMDQFAAGGQFGVEARAPLAAAAAETAAAMQKILDQMSQWESFVDVVNQLRQVIKLQNELMEATGELRKRATDALFDN